MLTEYLQAAMRKAHYEILEEDGTFYGEIPELPGVYAVGETLELCRGVLAEVLEEWLLVGLRLSHPIPPLDGIDLTPQPATA